MSGGRRRERRAERARKLEMYARLLVLEAEDLNATRTPCSCCGLSVAEDLDEWQWSIQLEATVKKIRKIAASMRGHVNDTEEAENDED